MTMIIKNLSIYLVLIISIFFNINQNVYAVDLDSLKSKQNNLEFLKNEDLANLVFFSEYDLGYDNKLYFNPAARDIVQKFSAAETHYAQSNVSVAFYEYRNLIKNMPKNDFYYMLIAYKLAENGFFTLAHNAMMKVEDKEIWEQHINFIRTFCFPKYTLKVTEEVFLASLLSDIVYNNMTDESLIKLEKDGKLFAEYDYAKYIRAKAYFIEKKYKEALIQINKAISENSNNIFYKKLKADILNASNKEKEALNIIKQIENNNYIFVDIQRDLDKIKYHALSKIEKNENKQKYYLAYYFYLNKDYQRAINELKMLMIKGDNYEAPKLLGKIFEITDQPENAKKIYNKQIAKNNKNAYAHKGLGNIYLSAKDYQNAFIEYNEANKYCSNDIDTLIALSVISYKLNKNDMTQKYLKKLNSHDPNNYKVLYLNSKIKTDKGILYLKSSIKQNPLFAGGWLDLAEQALILKDITSAEENINAAAFITKKCARYFYFKSILNTNKQDYDTAQKDINRAEEILKERKQDKYEQI